MYNTPSKRELKKIPRLYSSENLPLKEKRIYFHFFLCNSNWYVAEYDGDDLFFGFACLNGLKDSAEWGIFSFKKLKNLKLNGKIEIDKKSTILHPLEVSRNKSFKIKKAYQIPLIKECQRW